jgi:peroxiredoxin Q/BCP
MWYPQNLEVAMKLSVVLLGGLLATGLCAQQIQPPHTQLKVGDTAPDFTLPSTSGGKVTLSSFRGKNAVVLAFFPAAFSPGWTKEFLAYQAGIANFEGQAVKVLGISTDNTFSQREFAAKLKLSMPLLSDFAQRQVSKEYGVLVPQAGVSNRATFVIDKDGKIASIEEGSSAIDPSGAETACSRLAHRAAK